jgi:hypothetical protein
VQGAHFGRRQGGAPRARAQKLHLRAVQLLLENGRPQGELPACECARMPGKLSSSEPVLTATPALHVPQALVTHFIYFFCGYYYGSSVLQYDRGCNYNRMRRRIRSYLVHQCYSTIEGVTTIERVPTIERVLPTVERVALFQYSNLNPKP